MASGSQKVSGIDVSLEQAGLIRSPPLLSLHLKMRFAQKLVDGAEGEEEREVRLSTFFGMVEERGGKVSRATLRHVVNARRAHTDSIGFYSIS